MRKKQRAASRALAPKRDHTRLYGQVAGITAIMVILLFIMCDVYPFGDRTLRFRVDGPQYFGIIGYLQRTFFTNDNVLFSWGTVLGGNVLGILAYYSTSPFNLITVLFPNNLMAAYHVVVVTKLITAALFFAIMLRNIFVNAKDSDTVLFACSYPFIGYITRFGWNPSWMDGVVFLPLIVLGVWNIATRRAPLLYTLALAVTLFSNYYIGYMTLLASCLLFVVGMALFWKHIGRLNAARACVSFVASIAMAVALVAVLLLPTYLALPKGRSSTLNDVLNDPSYSSTPQEILSMLYTAPYQNSAWWSHGPLIYVGSVQLVLVVLFFLNSEIPSRLKAGAAALLIAFAVSFILSGLNTLWHGMSVPVGSPFRFSFIAAFVMEVIAFISFTRIAGAQGKLLISATFIAGITAFALTARNNNLSASNILWDICCISITLLLLRYYMPRSGDTKKTKQRRTICFILIAGLTWCAVLRNAYLTLDDLGHLESYTDGVDTYETIEGIIDDDGFYRMGSTWRDGENAPMRFGYSSVESYASPENAEAIETAARLGVRVFNRVFVYYGSNVPISTDALLGLRYVVADNGMYKSHYYPAAGYVPSKDLAVMENPIALPVIFPAETTFMSGSGNPSVFEYINNYWNSISSVGGNIFSNVAFETESVPTSDGSDLRISFTADVDGPVYAYVPRGDVVVEAPMHEDQDEIFCLGDFAAGENGELVVRMKETYPDSDRIAMYSENINTLEAKALTVLKDDIQLTKRSSSHLALQYRATSDGFLASTIPYDEGWRVYVDGREVNTYRNMDSFLAFDVQQGQHEIELIYWPPGFWSGVFISGSAVALLSTLVLRRYFFNKGKRAQLSSRDVPSEQKPKSQKRKSLVSPKRG